MYDRPYLWDNDDTDFSWSSFAGHLGQKLHPIVQSWNSTHCSNLTQVLEIKNQRRKTEGFQGLANCHILRGLRADLPTTIVMKLATMPEHIPHLHANLDHCILSLFCEQITRTQKFIVGVIFHVSIIVHN